MLQEFINSQKPNLNFPSPKKRKIKILHKMKNKSRNKIDMLPKINSLTSLTTINNYNKITSLSGSINVLYKSLYPEEKNTLENFLVKYRDLYLKRPNWKFSLKQSRNDDIIRHELMKKNRTMRSYEYLRKPTKLKIFKNRKPNMVQIIEDNNTFKYRFILNPWEEEYYSYKMKKNNSSSKNIFEYLMNDNGV